MLRTGGHQLAVFLQRGQVVEGIGTQIGAVDEVHGDVAKREPVLVLKRFGKTGE